MREEKIATSHSGMHRTKDKGLGSTRTYWEKGLFNFQKEKGKKIVVIPITLQPLRNKFTEGTWGQSSDILEGVIGSNGAFRKY